MIVILKLHHAEVCLKLFSIKAIQKRVSKLQTEFNTHSREMII
jgi:hypothetical protein